MHKQKKTQMDRALEKSASALVKNVLGIKKGESVLIITNPSSDVLGISEAIYSATLKKGAKPVICIQPVKSQMDSMEKAVRKAIESEPDIVMSISEMKLGKDEDALQHPYIVDGKEYLHIFDAYMAMKKIRAVWMPGITKEIFRRTVDIDYKKMQEIASKLVVLFESAEKVKIQNAKGTDIEIGISGRKAKLDDGNYMLPGTGGNIPAGEVYISPAIGSTNGVVVFDGSISTHEGDVVVKSPVKVEFRDGYAKSIKGGSEAKLLVESIRRAKAKTRELEKEGKLDKEKANVYFRNTAHLGELGIGLNPNARITGNMLEDEKVYGTCHLAIGANYDEDAPAVNHYDCLVKKPTILVLKNGEWIEMMNNGNLNAKIFNKN